jgi:hypothetical protein
MRKRNNILFLVCEYCYPVARMKVCASRERSAENGPEIGMPISQLRVAQKGMRKSRMQ